MTQSDMIWWEQKRAKGRGWFIFQDGILRYGLQGGFWFSLFGLLASWVGNNTHPTLPGLILKLIGGAVGFAICFGPFIGLALWNQYEKDYQKQNEAAPAGTRAVRLFSNNFTRSHAIIAGGLFLIFALLAACCCVFFSQPAQNASTTLAASLAVVAGPFTAGIIHPDSRWRVALATLPFFGSFIGLGTLFQVLRLPPGRRPRVFQMVTWTLGLVVWFCGAILSLLCAFD